MNVYLKVACCAALLAVWAAFVLMGKTDAGGFIAAVTGVLTAMGAIGISNTTTITAPPADPVKPPETSQ